MFSIAQEKDIDLNASIQVLYFYIPEMPFHRKISYILGTMEEQYKCISCLAINCLDFPNQCIRFSVSVAPTLLIFKNGREVKRVESSVRKRDFIDAFADICTP
jgi:Thioredoxin